MHTHSFKHNESTEPNECCVCMYNMPLPKSSRCEERRRCAEGHSQALVSRRPETAKPGGHRVRSV